LPAAPPGRRRQFNDRSRQRLHLFADDMHPVMCLIDGKAVAGLVEKLIALVRIVLVHAVAE
jgi:hypothetical protein